MYLTLTSSSAMAVHLSILDRLDEKADARRELVRGPLERGDAVVGARRVRDAPVHAVGRAGEVRADLAHAVAERDDAVEAPAGELVQVLRCALRDVDAAPLHHAHGGLVQRLRVAARTRRRDATV